MGRGQESLPASDGRCHGHPYPAFMRAGRGKHIVSLRHQHHAHTLRELPFCHTTRLAPSTLIQVACTTHTHATHRHEHTTPGVNCNEPRVVRGGSAISSTKPAQDGHTKAHTHTHVQHMDEWGLTGYGAVTNQLSTALDSKSVSAHPWGFAPPPLPVKMNWD